jgi:hypothetical protein
MSALVKRGFKDSRAQGFECIEHSARPMAQGVRRRAGAVTTRAWVTGIPFKTTSMAFSERGPIFKGLANVLLFAMVHSPWCPGGVNP